MYDDKVFDRDVKYADVVSLDYGEIFSAVMY